MLRIAGQFFWHKKKSSLLLLLIVTLSLALMLVIGPMFEGTRQSIFDAYASRHGLHHGAIFWLDDQKIQKLAQKQEELDYGLLSNYGQWELTETKQPITLGWFSEEALQLGKLRLLEGRLPETAEELVLERNVVKYNCPQGTQVGDTLTFTQEGVQKQFVLVGILADYVGNWDTFSNESVIEGVNDYPRGLLGQQAAPQQETRIALVYWKQAWKIDTWVQMSILSQELNGASDLSIEDSVPNEQLYFQVEENIMQPFRSFRQLMLAVVVVGAVLIMFVSMGLYIHRFKASYYTMYLLGAGLREVGLVYGGQCGAILLLGIPGGALLAQCIAWLYEALGGTSLALYTWSNFLWPMLALAAMGGFMFLAFRKSVAPMAEYSLSQQKQSKYGKPMKATKHMLRALAGSFIRQNFRKAVLVLLVVALLVSAMGTAKIYEKQFEPPENYDMAFSIYANRIYTALWVDTFQLTNQKGRVFPIRAVQELKAMDGVLDVKGYTPTDVAMIIPTTGSAYWSHFAQILRSDSMISAADVPGMPIEGVTVLPRCTMNYSIEILSEENLQEYLDAYPDLPIAQMREEGSVAMILPPIEAVSKAAYEGGGVPVGALIGAEQDIHYDSVQQGDNLRFGWLEYADDILFSELKENPHLLQYTEQQYEIAYITETAKVTDRGYGTFVTEVPTVLLLEETNEQTGLVKGMQMIGVVTEGDITEQQYAALEEKVIEIALGNSGSLVESAREEREQNKQLMRIVNLSLAMILCVFGAFTVTAIYSVLYMTILQRKRSIAIYRALGLRRRTLTWAMLWELLFYWCIAIFMALVLSIAIFHITWYIANLWNRGAPMFWTLIIALAVGIPLNGCIVWSLQRGIYGESVYSAMRFEE